MSVIVRCLRNGLRLQAVLTLLAAVGLAAVPGPAGILLWHARWDPGFHAANPAISLRVVALLLALWSGAAWWVSNRPALSLRHAAGLFGTALAGGAVASFVAVRAGTLVSLAQFVRADTVFLAVLAG